jgi:preprotein translocase subunit SecE
MATVGPIEFLKQVRAETAKVVWPSRRETVVTSIMVVVMAVLASVFFLLADQVFSKFIGFILTLGQ